MYPAARETGGTAEEASLTLTRGCSSPVPDQMARLGMHWQGTLAAPS